jgi:peptide/nickel transport system permease protein
MANTLSTSTSHASEGYVNRRSKEMLDRFRGTRSKRQKMAEHLLEASQYQLMLVKFRKHKLANLSFWVLLVMYIMAIFADFFAPYSTVTRFQDLIYAPPTKIHLQDEQGNFHLPFMYARVSKLNEATYTYSFEEDTSQRFPIQFFTKGEPYQMLGIIQSNIHLFGTSSKGPIFIFGSDNLGRDMFSRIVFAARVSLFIGLGGVLISFFLGILLGGISGFFGGTADLLIQRLIEFIMSVPQIPLWMGLSAAIPINWTGIQKFFAIVLILSLVGWTGLARVVRGKIISLREEDYVTAAKISSASDMAIIFRHLLPGFTSYLIVHITISIPGMILGETTLSFLGLGITPPNVSWGSLLQQAQDVTVLGHYPWLLYPCAAIILAVVLFNFMGDGLRDAADPYTR